MSDEPVSADEASLRSTMPLPPPRPEFLDPASGEESALEKSYFHPERWDEQFNAWQGSDKHDPVAYDRGKLTGNARAVLLLSDFHLGDGSAGGDDFLDSHILPDEKLGVHAGFAPAGESRAIVFASVLSFALDRVQEVMGANERLDVVLNGDVINMLELKGRGSTLVSPKHKLLFRTLAASQAFASVYWLRGNHDYVVPSGPWQSGEFYVNPQLRVLAEHGDYWDRECWPPGPDNKGSRLVIEAGALFEVLASLEADGRIKYLMSGIDNLRPWNDDAIEGFLDRRKKLSDVALLGAPVSRLHFLGAADDRAGYEGALARRKKPYRDWLIVQGHTHVPAFVPNVYYNTGSWIATLVEKEGNERHVEAFPFLLALLNDDGTRKEEYYTVRDLDRGQKATLKLEDKDSVDALRESLGYKNSIP
jgi:UDP-2,3-diacylglucosamine pyrophosphatase LpxH